MKHPYSPAERAAQMSLAGSAATLSVRAYDMP